MVEVLVTEATTPDGSVLQEIHELLRAHELLAHQHLMDRGDVDAQALGVRHRRSQVDRVGPVMADTGLRLDTQRTALSTATFASMGRPNGSSVLLAKPVKSGGRSRIGTASSGFGSGFLCRCAARVRCMPDSRQTGAKVLYLRPDEQSYTALQQARQRQHTPAFWALYAKRAGIEGTMAQAVRPCEMRRARYLGSKKLRLQAFVTATAITVLRAVQWLKGARPAWTPVSRFARLIAAATLAVAA